jgi:hypothetical protein
VDFKSVSQNKTIDMTPDGFSEILNEFSKDFKHRKGLAKELHELLFSIRDGGPFTGTDMDQDGINRLYDGLIDAFDTWIG